ncbi:MAG: DUF2182 domain-containing protein [Chloroflexi bacterium]|nr:DUF2182 domain-containing protein [Chloroflexota bacterium]
MLAEGTLRRPTVLVLSALLLLSAAAWGLLLWRGHQGGGAEMGDMGPGLTLGMGMPLFLAMWVLMMVAMMFPTAAPMILTFARVARSQKSRGQAYVPTWFFVGSYLAVWTVFGVVAYVGATAAGYAVARVVFLEENAGMIVGAVLAAAGLYQLSPVKGACLSQCRTPMGFVLRFWRRGYAGALRMGIVHGTYCLGCCWLLFVVLFPLGVMNVAAMGLVTLLIFAEKSLRHGVWVGRGVGVGLALLGLAVAVLPGLLPAVL